MAIILDEWSDYPVPLEKIVIKVGKGGQLIIVSSPDKEVTDDQRGNEIIADADNKGTGS